MEFTSEDLRKMVVALEMGAATLEKHKLFSFTIKAKKYQDLAFKLDQVVAGSPNSHAQYSVLLTQTLEYFKGQRTKAEAALNFILSQIPNLGEEINDPGPAVVRYIANLRKATEKGTKKTKKK